MFIGGDQLELPAAVSCCDKKSDENTDSSAIDVIYSTQIDHDLRSSGQQVPDSLVQGGTFIAENDAAFAMQDIYVTRYLRVYS